jgi:hypothetical protein
MLLYFDTPPGQLVKYIYLIIHIHLVPKITLGNYFMGKTRELAGTPVRWYQTFLDFVSIVSLPGRNEEKLAPAGFEPVTMSMRSLVGGALNHCGTSPHTPVIVALVSWERWLRPSII